MIYFMQATDGGPVKIGYSADVGARLYQLESHYGTRLAVLATAEGGRAEEAELHTRFAHLRFGRTEQFQPAPDLMAFLGRPLLAGANPDAVEAMPVIGKAIIINLKGSADQAAWLEAVHRKTHISKSVIVRLALSEWAERNGHDAFPMEGSAEG